ncbi:MULTISPECIES: hypothetical protein [unclassified Sphingobium]|nr:MULTISPECIES: hypothetical protein [unclassified Sphingobium]
MVSRFENAGSFARMIVRANKEGRINLIEAAQIRQIIAQMKNNKSTSP